MLWPVRPGLRQPQDEDLPGEAVADIEAVSLDQQSRGAGQPAAHLLRFPDRQRGHAAVLDLHNPVLSGLGDIQRAVLPAQAGGLGKILPCLLNCPMSIEWNGGPYRVLFKIR